MHKKKVTIQPSEAEWQNKLQKNTKKKEFYRRERKASQRKKTKGNFQNQSLCESLRTLR